MTRRKFLQEVWSPHPRNTWLFVAAKKGKRWIDHPVQNDEKREQNVHAFLRVHPAREWDLYFCPNAFRSPDRRATEAVNTPYAWCDIDEAGPEQFEPPPGILWRTSPGRYQGLWRFTRRLRPIRAERISKYLAYEFDADRNGWSVTKYLRIPGTFNHKRDGRPARVKLLRCDLSPIDPRPLLRLAPKIRATNQAIDVGDFDLDRDPITLFKKHWRRIKHSKAQAMLLHRKVFVKDRSVQIFIMIKGLAEASVPWDDIACMIWHSPYFREKHGSNINALESEIQRAMNKFEPED